MECCARARACSVWHIRRSSFRAVASVIVRDTTEIQRSISALGTAAGCVIPTHRDVVPKIGDDTWSAALHNNLGRSFSTAELVGAAIKALLDVGTSAKGLAHCLGFALAGWLVRHKHARLNHSCFACCGGSQRWEGGREERTVAVRAAPRGVTVAHATHNMRRNTVRLSRERCASRDCSMFRWVRECLLGPVLAAVGRFRAFHTHSAYSRLPPAPS